MVKLKEVHKKYQQWLNVSDIHRIDCGLAIALTSKRTGRTRVWLIIIGPSGDWKSIQISALSDFGLGKNTIFLRKLTKNTLVSGNPKVKDLAPDLDEKLVLIPEMASILKLDPKEKAQIWAQLRDLFDGIAGGVFGTGKKVDYKNLHVTLIMGSTPAIDSQILIHQDLGQRELIWRTNPSDSIRKKKDTMEKVWQNEEHEETMEKELQKITYSFLRDITYNPNINLSKETRTALENFSLFLSYMRAPAEVDAYTGQLLSDVCPEEPTRILKQLKILTNSLLSLDEDYSEKQALQVIQKVVFSSSNPKRIRIFKELMLQEEDLTIQKLVNIMRLGYKTIQKEIFILWNLKLVSKKEQTVTNAMNKSKTVNTWYLNLDNHYIKEIKDLIEEYEEQKIE